MYEIEIKSLLGSRERADELKRRLVELFPALRTLPPHKQRNHYFNAPKDLRIVENAVAPPYQSKEKRAELSRILKNAKGEVSIRTREADGKVSFILKASIGDDTSANGISRIEFECVIAPAEGGRDCGTTNAAHANEDNIRRPETLEELDQILLDAGLVIQAKWSREREHFDLGDIHITVDKNAGYGYLAEFEKMIDDPVRGDGATPASNGASGAAEHAKQELKALMVELGCTELPQARLERMFKFYNEHWQEYYGTDKVFTVE